MASDGGVFGFSSPFYGSRAGLTAEDRFFSIVPTSDGGYLLVGQHPAQ